MLRPVKLEKLSHARPAALQATPVVSVLIPAWRRPKTVVRAVESVLAEKDVPREAVLVVDGCAETAAAARALAGRDGVVVIESAVNLGVARSRNRALEVARGELCLHLDAGDALAPGALRAVALAFEGRPHLGAVYGDLALEDGTGTRHGERREPVFPGRRAFLEEPFDVPLVAYRRSVGRAAGGLDEGAVRCDNASLIARIARTHAVRKLERVLVTHRIDGKNRSLRYRPEDCGSCASATSCLLADARRRMLARDVPRLKRVSLVLTTRCNLDCSYCYTRRYKWDLATEDCLRLLVQARDLGAASVSLTGGEPSLHEGFDTVISSAADLGFEVVVISNGWNWPDERIARFVSLPRSRLALSLEGRTAEVHDRIRGKGAFATLVRFHDRIREKAPPGYPISGIVIVTPDNAGEIEDICAWAIEDLKLFGVRLDRVAPSGNAEANEEYSPEATRRYLDVSRRAMARWPNRIEALVDSFPEEGCPLYVKLPGDELIDFAIFSDGTVPMCVYLHLDVPTRLGTTALDLEELVTKRNCARAKTLIDEVFRDRPRQIARKGIFTCIECLERKNALERDGRWPPRRALQLAPEAQAPVVLRGRPWSAAERSGLAGLPVVVG